VSLWLLLYLIFARLVGWLVQLAPLDRRRPPRPDKPIPDRRTM
jgi:hypothetical protein